MTRLNKYIRYCCIGFYYIIPGLYTLAQSSSDTLRLPEFEIKSSFILDSKGFKRVRLDSGLLARQINADLSTIISQNSTIFIKSYGNGALSTPSFRGTSAQHTQVEWNGISLNSPMLGQVDFSQIPVSQFDGIEILYGSAGISRSGGAFGGIIDLVTRPLWTEEDRIMIYQKVGSFGSLGTNVNIATGNPTFQADLKFNYSTAVNDFPFTKENGEVVNQRNASFARVGLSQELFWRLKTRHLISAKAWYSQDDRSLPPTEFTYDLPKTETLNDKFLRAVLEYKLVNEGWSVQVRSALNYQFMIYDNNLPEINSAHRSVSWINRIRFSYARIKNLTIRPGIDFTHDRVQSKDYESELTTRNTTSLFIELAYDFTRKLKSSIVLREDIIDGSFGNLIPAFGIEYLPFNKINLAFTANASRNYRYPTLNDLFWKSAGSPDLQPETNYAFEVGGTFQIGNRSHVWYLETTLTGFYYRIFDMIAWIQSEEESLFRPENIDEVFSRGLETGLNFGKRVCKFWLEMKTNYAFCKSTYENLRSPNDERLHRQQTYMPVHNFNSSVSIERWNYYCHYNISYISYRYTNTDNIMPGYSLSNIIFGKEFKLKQFILSLQLDINNLFNLDYQAIDSRPMPGINYAFSVKLNFSMPGSSQINNQDKP